MDCASVHFRQIKIELTTPAIINGFSNPIFVLPSLPLDKAYRMIDFVLDVRAGTTPFDNSSGIVVTSDTSNVNNGQRTCGGLDSAINVFTGSLVNSNIDNHIHPGRSLFLQCVQNSTQGDGNAIAYVTYFIMDL